MIDLDRLILESSDGSDDSGGANQVVTEQIIFTAVNATVDDVSEPEDNS